LEATRYSVVLDADSDLYGTSGPFLEMRWYRVTKRTAKGAWLDQRFVLLDTDRKKWACSTEADATESFRSRRQLQIKILTMRLRRAEEELNLLVQGRDPFGPQPSDREDWSTLRGRYG
jgi:hypothetical protein